MGFWVVAAEAVGTIEVLASARVVAVTGAGEVAATGLFTAATAGLTAETRAEPNDDDESAAVGWAAVTLDIADRAVAEALVRDAAGPRYALRALGPDTVDCRADDDESEDAAASAVSADATTGSHAISGPTPRANANAPTRPTYSLPQWLCLVLNYAAPPCRSAWPRPTPKGEFNQTQYSGHVFRPSVRESTPGR